jgi:thymidine kinase
MSAKITVIYGCMFAGKTTELIARARQHEAEGEKVIAFKHCIDSRYAQEMGKLVSHTQDFWPARRVGNLNTQITRCAEYTCVLVDEAQFFEDVIEFVENIRTLPGVRYIILAGLDLTYSRQPFGKMRELLEIAEEKVRLYAQCSECGSEAMFTHRNDEIIPEECRKEVIVIGGSGLYSARCSEHL